MRVLFAEDEQDLNNIISTKLRDEGYSVDNCYDGLTAMDWFDAAEYDGVILDIMMPGADGFKVLEHIRSRGSAVPVIFLTARDAVADRVAGLDKGATDYIVKPFALEELMARVRTHMRTAYGQTSSVLKVADLELDQAAHSVRRAGREISLSAKEYQLLEYMMLNNGRVLSRENIENHIWDFGYEGGTNVVDVYISYLRRKIDGESERKLIHTVRGVGYAIRE